MTDAFSARTDRYSQLLGRSLASDVSTGSMVSRSTLTDAERDELRSLQPEAHQAFVAETARATERLRRLLSKSDPLYTLAMLQISNLIAVPGQYFEPTHRGMESKVELIAGLLVTQEPPAKIEPASHGQTQQVFDEIDHLMTLSTLVNLTVPTRGDEAVDQLRFASALSWTTVRGTSYAPHGRELAEAIYGPFNHWCTQRFGFTIADVLAIGEAAHELFEARYNRARQSLAEAYASAPINRLGEPDRQAITVPLERFWQQAAASTQFTIGDLPDRVDPERAKAVLDELSIELGSVPADTYRGLFDRSPLIERPFISYGDRYVLAVPGMVLREPVGILEKRFLREVSTFSRSRAKTLDRLAVEFISSLLPDSRAYANLHYGDPELDGLVLFEDIAFVIEGKGSALSTAARRGDTERLRRDVAKTVEEAWTQAARARSYLLSESESVFTDERGREVLRLAPATVKQVFIVNPTLHELGGHGSQLPRFRALGLFPEAEYPWSVFINDLRVITETAGNAAVFLHYFTWRGRLPLGDRVIAVDELDLWGLYLLGHRFGSLAEGGTEFVANSTTDFDDYYAGLVGRGPKAQKPEKFLKGAAKRFVERMARERPTGWLPAAAACLDLSPAEIGYVVTQAVKLARAAKRTGQLGVSECGRVRLIGLPPGREIDLAIQEIRMQPSDTTFDIFVGIPRTRRAEILWAQTVKQVTFELSGYENAVAAAVGDV